MTRRAIPAIERKYNVESAIRQVKKVTESLGGGKRMFADNELNRLKVQYDQAVKQRNNRAEMRGSDLHFLEELWGKSCIADCEVNNDRFIVSWNFGTGRIAVRYRKDEESDPLILANAERDLIDEVVRAGLVRNLFAAITADVESEI